MRVSIEDREDIGDSGERGRVEGGRERLGDGFMAHGGFGGFAAGEELHVVLH